MPACCNVSCSVYSILNLTINVMGSCSTGALSGLVGTFPSCHRVGAGWGVGGCWGQVRCYLIPLSFGESLPPALKSHTHSAGVCTVNISAARTHRQTLSSIRLTPMMRGCSSRVKHALNQDSAGKKNALLRLFRPVHAGVSASW